MYFQSTSASGSISSSKSFGDEPKTSGVWIDATPKQFPNNYLGVFVAPVTKLDWFFDFFSNVYIEILTYR